MRADLLRTPPVSGTALERHFDVSGRSNTWVRFADDEGNEWVGVFGSAELAPFEAVVPFADDGGQTVLVIAGGQGYIVNAVSGDLLRRTPWDYAHQAVGVPESGRILVASLTELWATDRVREQHAWRREPPWYDYDEVTPAHRVALDGIVLDVVTAEMATGKVWEMDGWYDFTLRLADLEFRRGDLVSPDWESFGLRRAAG